MVAFAVGICTVFFDIAYGAYLPFLVKREQLVEGNTKLEFTNSAARIGGPPLAGGLIVLLGAPFAVAINALSYALSSLFVVFIRKREPLPEPDKPENGKSTIFEDVKQGLRYVLTHPLLRPTAIFGLVTNFALAMVEAVFLVYVVRSLGLEAGAIGIIFSIGNVGLLAAAAVAGTIA
ncbi:MAG: MFS transporter [Truepera sp.]|nr:MFS transporter [Truepera sp.]